MMKLVETLQQSNPVDKVFLKPLFEKAQKESSQELPQVETAPGQDGVDFVVGTALTCLLTFSETNPCEPKI